jgi:hypothetical protein
MNQNNVTTNFLENPCFITGFCRSGTNLLNRLLDGNKYIIAPPGQGKIHSLRRLYYIDFSNKRRREIYGIKKKNLEYQIGQNETKKVLSCINEQLRDYMVYKEVLNAIIIGTLDYLKLDKKNKKTWIEKNHNNEFYIHNALRIFRNPKFIFLARDPRDIWSSWKLLCKKDCIVNDHNQFSLNVNTHILEDLEAMLFGDSRFTKLEDLSEHYKVDIEYIKKIIIKMFDTNKSLAVLKKTELKRKNFEYINTDVGRFAWNYKFILNKAMYNSEIYSKNFVIIRYEDIVLKTEKTMQSIANFLNIKFSKDMLVPTYKNEKWTSNSSYRKTSKISKESLGSYKIKISKNESMILSEIFKKEMSNLGYK